MKILILGGTAFLGPALVTAALERGHELTLFNRGRHNPDLFPEVEKLRGDRDGGLDALRDRRWDAVVDTCGYFPRVVRQSSHLLADAVGHYTFISSISVYSDFRQPWDENGPLAEMDDAEAESASAITNETYGPLKAKCEQTVQQSFRERALIIRPGIIVGPHDPTDRFTSWLTRTASGGRVLAPGSRDQRVQLIDVRDLAEWNIRMVEANRTGVFNAAGPDYRLTLGQMLDTCRTITGGHAELVFVPGEFLHQQNVDPGSLSSWCVSEDDENARCVWEIDSSKAQSAGLRFRALSATAGDTWKWVTARTQDPRPRSTLTEGQEAAVLDAWENRTE